MALHLRLPSLLEESHSKNSATDGKEEVVKVLERVRDRLRESKSKRPRPSRPKRKKKPPLIGEEGKEKKNEGETEEKEDEACELEKEIREKKAVKKEKIKKEKKKNKTEASKEEKEKEMKEAALETTNGQNESISEQKAIVSDPSSKLADSEDNTKKVYVGGIPYYSSEDDIKNFFESCGTVTDVDCMKLHETGKFQGIAILTFTEVLPFGTNHSTVSQGTKSIQKLINAAKAEGFGSWEMICLKQVNWRKLDVNEKQDFLKSGVESLQAKKHCKQRAAWMDSWENSLGKAKERLDKKFRNMNDEIKSHLNVVASRFGYHSSLVFAFSAKLAF
ncbi:protein gar2 [Carex littledalei]|uniref:Protein gar2 n=1 Tax=Carex littledalei TaxID=544730 RepID=A0A833R3N5_9POAL|nr:protein gar2 [Carex littledalei]